MDFSSQPMSDNVWLIEAGTCYVMFAYDAARSIDLNAAEKRMQQSTQRPTLLKKRRTPSYFEYQPPPLRVSQEIEPLQVNGHRSGTSIDLMIFDFGSMAATYQFALSRRFHLDEWDCSILRKLQTLESIYEKISDQAAARRMEVLEWIIILLIAFSIALEFIH